MRIKLLVLLSIIYSKDIGKHFPEKYFRTDHSLIDAKIAYEDFSCNMPIDLKKIEISEISVINNKLELEQNSFHETDIIDIYKNEEDTFGICISKVKLNSTNSIFSDDYTRYLVKSFSTENIYRYQFSFDNIKVIQYQINHLALVQLKIFLLLKDSTYGIDFLIDRNNYYNYINHVESMLSTIQQTI